LVAHIILKAKDQSFNKNIKDIILQLYACDKQNFDFKTEVNKFLYDYNNEKIPRLDKSLVIYSKNNELFEKVKKKLKIH
jgi:cytochrome c biogenesis protein ResB